MKTLFRNFRWWRDGESQEMLVEDGRIVYRSRSTEETPAGAVVEDLGGKRLFPSFIDNHCHVLPTGLDLQKLHLGTCTSNADVLDAISRRLPSISGEGWLKAVHYDQTKFEGIFLTRTDLDSISAETPILLRHVNGHAGVANSAALRAASIADDAADPDGGTFGRFDDGRVNGVLFESANDLVDHRSPIPTLDEMVDAILLAGERMSEVGIVLACDMMTGRFDLASELDAYQLASEQGCKVATRLYLQWGEVFRRDGGFRSSEVGDRIQKYGAGGNWNSPRIGGVKIFADGAIGSATAAIYGRYSGAASTGYRISRHARPAENHAPAEAEVSGQIIYTPERLEEMVRIADDAGFRIAIHSIGNYATDLVMDAYQGTSDSSRHRIEHAMILSDSQIERMAALGLHCSMQPEFLMRFGHSYRRQLGPDRTALLNRARSLLKAGVTVSFSSDRPIVGGDPLDGIKMAVERPDGFDAAENVDFEDAIDAYTTRSAAAIADESDWGGLNPGQFAMFRVADD